MALIKQTAPLQQAAPIVAPNMNPAYDALKAGLQQQYAQAANFGRIDPTVLREALSNGGSLSNTFGFNSPTDVLGLSPQELMMLTQGQSVNNQLQQGQKTFDAVTGGPENRDAIRSMANQLFQGGQRFEADKANNQMQVDSANQRSQQDVYNQQFSVNNRRAESEASLQEQVRHSREVERQGLEGLRLKASEMKYWQSFNAQQQAQPQTGLPFDSELQEHYTKQATYWAGKDDPLSKVNMATNQLYAVALGQPFNKAFDVNDANLARYLNGATQVVLRPDGFYGRKVVDGKYQYVSMKPVLGLPGQDQPKTKKAGSGSAGKRFTYNPQ